MQGQRYRETGLSKQITSKKGLCVTDCPLYGRAGLHTVWLRSAQLESWKVKTRPKFTSASQGGCLLPNPRKHAAWHPRDPSWPGPSLITPDQNEQCGAGTEQVPSCSLVLAAGTALPSPLWPLSSAESCGLAYLAPCELQTCMPSPGY